MVDLVTKTIVQRAKVSEREGIFACPLQNDVKSSLEETNSIL